jgi:hypothetical protein
VRHTLSGKAPKYFFLGLLILHYLLIVSILLCFHSSHLLATSTRCSVVLTPFFSIVVSDPKADAALFRAYLKGLAYLERKKKDKTLRDESNLPEILFAGVESHGKSSFLQLYLGFPCNYIAAGTGTRCPIKFKIHREPNSQDASVECTVDRRSVARLALGKAIADHMAGIVSSGSQFSGTELIVECWSCKRDGVLVDLPGLVDNLTQAAAGAKSGREVRSDATRPFFTFESKLIVPM